ncbi:Uncharacterized protein APZ42_018970 [Daphnia magna]|uniref:Uncharacterized protein n=1 Tax=Daphnia magna TaxID=35525 RepID=A0A164YYY9_9CRUS|nr:Uncharacterized protein APZ42_018970 [Daphnia magna]
MYMVAEHQHGRFDASTLHIAHALRATELKHSNRRPIEKPLDSYLDKDTQVELEMKHRKEEDDLYRKFARQREEEQFKFKEEFRGIAAKDNGRKSGTRMMTFLTLSSCCRVLTLKRKLGTASPYYR